MLESLFNKIIEKGNLQAYLSERTVDPLYFPDFFPMTDTMFLTYQTIIGSQGAPVMADITSYNASAPRKSRKTVSILTGTIQPIRVERQMEETDMNQVMQLQAMNIAGYGGSTNRKQQILDLIYNDVDFVFNAVQSRLEWLALKILSYPKLTLSKSTNPGGIVTETTIDFQMPSTNKKAASVIWSASASTTKPITDIKAVVAAAKLLGKSFKYIVMDDAYFTYFALSAEVKNYVYYGAVADTSTIAKVPNLATINQMLAAERLPTIIVVDTALVIENDAGTQTSANPWNTGYVTFIPDLKVGETLVGPNAERQFPPKHVTQAERDRVLISKWSEVNPVKEHTKGEINAFPSWTRVDDCFSLKVSATSWS